MGWTILFATALIVTGCRSARPSPGWEHWPPKRMLEEVGRVCGDASTFEAVGYVEGSKRASRQHRRWVFRDDGAYRFESADGFIVFDGRCVGIWDVPNLSTSLIDYTRISSEDDSPPTGLHHRQHGDLVMATGFACGAMTHPIAAMRILGRAWVKEVLNHKDVKYLLQGEVTISTHLCREVRVECADLGAVVLWLDLDIGVIRKLQYKLGDDLITETYDQIRINPVLSASEFEIPDQVYKAASTQPQ